MRTSEPLSPEQSLQSLLEPTLSAASPARPLYSVRANCLVAFFGGLYAAALFCALNAVRMRRPAQDIWICAVASGAWTVVLVWAGYAIADGSMPSWLNLMDRPGRTLNYAGRLLALVLFGALYRRQRAIFKAQEFASVAPPNPWPMGLLAIGASIALSIAMVGIGALLGHG